MTSSTMPVLPGRDASPAGTGPVPWRGMLWVTWRQHRGLLIGVLVTFSVAVPGMLYAGLKIHRDYATLAACHPVNSAACLNLSNWFHTDWHPAVSQLLTRLFVPFLTTQDITVLSPAVFDTRDLAYAAWTLTAFCLGAFFGALIRRVIPAMAATLGGYLLLGALTWLYLQYHYPGAAFWPRQLFESGWLLAFSALLVAGTLRLIRRSVA